MVTMVLAVAAGCSGDSVVIQSGPLDIAIAGDGFFQVRMVYNDEEILAYTRVGNFVANKNGDIILANSQGTPLVPSVSIPEEAINPHVSPDGRVQFTVPGDPAIQEAGQTIELARFVNPEELTQIGENLFIETDATGAPITGEPLQSGLGQIVGCPLRNICSNLYELPASVGEHPG